MDVNEIIKSEEDRAVLAELIAKIFGEDAEVGTVEMVMPGDVLKPLVKMYELGFNHASKLSDKTSQPLPSINKYKLGWVDAVRCVTGCDEDRALSTFEQHAPINER